MSTVMTKEAAITAMKAGYRSYSIKPFYLYNWESRPNLGWVNIPLPNLRLRNIRNILHIYQNELEQLMGMEKGYLWEIEDNHSEFTIEKQELISDWFGFGGNIFAMDVTEIQTVMRNWASDLQ